MGLDWENILFPALVSSFLVFFFFNPLLFSPLAKVPGPKTYALTKWRLAYDEWRGKRTSTIHRLHQIYGPAVRIGPNEVHFNSPTALRTIYGAGSGFERTDFYRMFDVYGRQNVFTFGPAHLHTERKKLIAHAYSKGSIIRGRVADGIEAKVQDYLRWIETHGTHGDEIFRSLHYFSLDNITNFLYGSSHGGTSALKGVEFHQALLDDILDPARRRLTWFMVHFPTITKWVYTRTGLLERILSPILPMQKPATYTRIREHALEAMKRFRTAVATAEIKPDPNSTVIERLWTHHESFKSDGLSDLDVAAECSDHFLAGIDTTSDTLMFLIWVLSLPEHRKYQGKLIEEARSMPESGLNKYGNPTVEASDKLSYLDAVIKETLRLYAPLPASEPREPPQDTEIDGYKIPGRTVVSMEPYALHRNPEVFPEPLKWDPERWLSSSANELTEMKRWWWAFSSGGRMCIGMHLGMAEMTALVPAIYRRYETRIDPRSAGVSPGITSRFEVFYDETFEKMEVNTVQHHLTLWPYLNAADLR